MNSKNDRKQHTTTYKQTISTAQNNNNENNNCIVFPFVLYRFITNFWCYAFFHRYFSLIRTIRPLTDYYQMKLFAI